MIAVFSTAAVVDDTHTPHLLGCLKTGQNHYATLKTATPLTLREVGQVGFLWWEQVNRLEVDGRSPRSHSSFFCPYLEL